MDIKNNSSNGWMYEEIPANAGDLAKFFANMDPDTKVYFNTIYCDECDSHATVDKNTLKWAEPSRGSIQIDLD